MSAGPSGHHHHWWGACASNILPLWLVQCALALLLASVWPQAQAASGEADVTILAPVGVCRWLILLDAWFRRLSLYPQSPADYNLGA